MPSPIRPWYWPERGQPERTEPFTWIVEGVIAASWWPDPYVFDIYDEQNIRAVVNCCEFDNRRDVPSQFTYHHINVPDYGVPTDAQIEQFMTLMDKHHAAREAVVVHCVAGCGRTGQFIVAWCARPPKVLLRNPRAERLRQAVDEPISFMRFGVRWQRCKDTSHRRHRFRAPEEGDKARESRPVGDSGVAPRLATALHDAGARFMVPEIIEA
jgi:hypothetical protein